MLKMTEYIFSSNLNTENSDTFSACWLFWCFLTPPNSDVDYRIFNARM